MKLTDYQNMRAEQLAYVLMGIIGLALAIFNVSFSLKSVLLVLGTWLVCSAYKEIGKDRALKKLMENKNVN